MHDKLGFNNKGLLVSVRHNTTDEVRLSVVQSAHELSQLDKIYRGDSLGTTSLLLLLFLIIFWGRRLAGMFPPQVDEKIIARSFQAVNNSVIDRILVLLKPTSDIV
jgi:hypothetical protein